MTPYIKTGLKAAGVVGAVVLAFGIGAGSTSAQIVEVEKIVEKPVDRIVTKTVEKKVTPQSCLDFIEQADKAFGYAADGLGYARDGIIAAGARDVGGMATYKAHMDDVTSKLQSLVGPVNTNKLACKLGV